MLLKAVVLFLIAIMILGAFGKLRRPRLPGPRDQKSLSRPGKCRKCGRFLIGGTCSCGKG